MKSILSYLAVLAFFLMLSVRGMGQTLPDAAGAISGTTTVCQGESNVTYSVPVIANATSYIWTVPSGANIVFSDNNLIRVNYLTSAVSGVISVKGRNASGDGALATLSITVNPIPGVAGTVTGLAALCQGTNNVNYSISAISNATNYVWTVPTGATIISSSTTPTPNITVNYSTSAVSGDVAVYGTNSCGNGIANSLAVTVTPLVGSAGPISGTNSICQGASAVPFQVSAIANATSYTWSYSGSGATFSGSSNSISVNFAVNATSGNFTVRGTNSCGSGAVSANYPVNILPLPDAAGAIAGPAAATVCQGAVSLPYSVPSINNATFYDWAYSGSGYTITEGTPGNITLTLAANATSGDLTVRGRNACGNGIISANYPVNVNPLPGAAGPIIGTSTVCQGQTAVAYSVASIANASDYIWSYSGTGANISANTSNVTITFSANATSGNLTVLGRNSCGDGTISVNYPITVNVLPGAAGTMSGLQTVCQGQAATTYSVSPIANATSYVWTYSGTGATITGAGTSVTIAYSTNASSGNLTVYGTNACGNGVVSQDYAILVNPLPVAAGIITGTAVVCAGQSGVTYTAPVITNASTYVWAYSGTNPPSFTTSRSQSVNFATNTGSGSFTVRGSNACGLGVISAGFPVSVNSTQDAPTVSMAASSSICEGTTFYTVSGASATNYSSLLWTSSGSGTFINATSLTPTYFPSTGDVTAGSVTLTMTATAISPCTSSVFGTQTLTLQSRPVVNAGPDGQICRGDVFTTSNATAINASSTVWSRGTGDGTFDNSSLRVTVYTPGPNDIANGGVLLTLTANYIDPPCGVGSVSDSFFLEIVPFPTATAGSNASVCSNGSYTVAGAAATNYSALTWSSSGSGVFSDTHVLLPVYTPSATDISVGSVTLTLTATPNVPCGNPVSGTMILTINPIADVNAGLDGTVCQSGSYTISGAVANHHNAGTIQWLTNGTGTFTNGNTMAPTYTPSAEDVTAGSVILTVRVGSLAPCVSTAEDFMVLTVTPTATVNAGPDGSTCGTTDYVITQSTQTNASSLTWTTSGTGTFSNPSQLKASYTPSANDVSLGSVTLTLTGTSGTACAGTTSDSFLLTISAPVIANAGVDGTVCEGGTYHLNGSAPNATSYNWTSTGTSVLVGAGTLAPFFTPNAAEVLAGSVTLTLHATAGAPCAESTDEITLTILKKPVISAGPDATACAGSNYPITLASALNSASVAWSTPDGTGTFSNPNILLPAYIPSLADLAAGHVTLRLTAQPVSPCSGAVTDDFVLTFVSPATANAGPDATICQSQSTYTIGGSSSASSSLNWTSSGTGTFVSGTTLTPTYAPSLADIAAGSVTLTLHAAGTAPCTDATDNMVLTIAPTPSISAGTATSVCQGNSLTVSDATASGYSTLLWTHNGTGSLTNPATLSPTYVPGSGETGSVTLTLTATASAPCSGQVIATKIVTIQPAPTANAGLDATICQPNSHTIFGATSANALSYSWTTSGTGTFTSANSLTPTYQPSIADYTTGQVILTLQVNGISPCTAPATDNMILNLKALPTSYAGLDAAICKGGSHTVSGAIVTNAASYLWTSSGSGTLSNEATLTPTYVAAATETGTVTLTLTATPNSPCTASVTDRMTITIQQPSTANAGVDASACEGTAYTITGTATNYSSITWSTNGSGIFTGTNTLTPRYTPTIADATLGTVSFTLTAVANSPCAVNATDAMTLTVVPKPLVNAGADANICATDIYSLTLPTASNYASISWSTSGDGTFTNAGLLNPVYTPGSSDITNGSVRLTLTAQPNSNCNAPVSDFMVLAINNLPTADAGPASRNICKESYTLSGTSAQNYSSILWTTSGVGTLTNATTLSPTYTPSAGDINAGSVTLTMTVQGVAPCSGTASDQIILVVKPPTPVISVLGGAATTFCEGGSITLTGPVAGYNYNWTPGGSSLQNNVVTTSGSYRVVITDPVTGCSSLPSNAITVTVLDAPDPPVSIGYMNQCWNGVGTPATLDARSVTSVPPTATINWYDVPTGGVVRTLPPLLSTVGTVTYYAETVDNSTPSNCLSLTRTAVTLTISTIPSTPVKGTDVSSNLSICETSPITSLTAGNLITPPEGTTIVWYTSATGGSPVSPTLGSVGTRTFYAEANNGTCASATRSAGVVLTIIAAPVPPVSRGNIKQCVETTPHTLTASATVPAGVTLSWWSLPVGGVVVSPTLSSGTIATRTFYAEATNNVSGCKSLVRTPVTIDVVSLPDPPVAASASVTACETNPIVPLVATASVPTGSTIKWYLTAVGGSPVANHSLNSVGTITYYAETDNGACISLTRTPITLTINPAPATPTSFGTATKCAEAVIVPLTATATATGSTISWYTSQTGGVPISGLPTLTTVGTITYYAEAINPTTQCASLSRSAPVVLTINATPEQPVTIDPIQEACQTGTSTTLTATATASGGASVTWYTAATGGTLVATPTLTGPGTVTYYAEALLGSCKSPSPRTTSVKLTINPAAATPVSLGNITACEQSPIQTLTARSSDPAALWYSTATGGSPVTPTLNSVGSVTYYAESLLGTCPSLARSAGVVLTIQAIPEAPVSAGDVRACEQNPMQTLTAVATPPAGSTVKWYLTATGGAPVASPTLNAVKAITYYAESDNGSCRSLTRTAVTLQIDAAPKPPVAGKSITECEILPVAQTITATATVPIGTTIKWYETAIGGEPLASLPTLSQVGTTTYYAEANGANGCNSTTRSAPVVLTINPTPAAPVAIDKIECAAKPLQVLTAEVVPPPSGVTITWYNGPTGGSPVAAPVLKTIRTQYYYAEAKQDKCINPVRTRVTLTIHSIVADPILKTKGLDSLVTCESIPIDTLDARDLFTFLPTVSYVCFDSATGGFEVSPLLDYPGTKTLYVAAQDTTTKCLSFNRVPVTLVMNAAPATPVSSGDIIECALSPLQTLDANNSVSPVAGSKVVWYYQATGDSVALSPTLNAADSTITYYAENVNNITKCKSLARTAVRLSLISTTASAASNSPISLGQTLLLKGGPELPGNSYMWTDPNGFSFNTMDVTVPNVTESAAGMYHLSVTSANGCVAKDSVKVVLDIANAEVQTPVCIGATLYLSGYPDNMKAYAWSGPNGFTSSEQNPAINNVTFQYAGTYTLVVTNANNATSQDTVSVSFKPLPIPIAEYSTVCPAGTLQLNAGPNGMTSYLWSTPSGFTSTLQKPAPMPFPNPAESFKLTVVDWNGCEASKTITPTPFQPRATSNAPLCTGDTLRLRGEPNGMASYRWSGPNSFVSTLQSPSLNNVNAATATGDYVLTVIDQAGCTFSTKVTVTFNPSAPVPTISPNMNPACEGSTLILTGGPSGMAKYDWTGPNGFIASEQSPQITAITALNAGRYTLTITNGTGCKNSFETDISVNSVIFNGTYGPYCIADSPVTLSATPSGGTFTGPGVSGNTFDPKVAGPGTHRIEYTYSPGGSCTILAHKIIDVVSVPNVVTNNPILPSCTGTTADLTLPAVTAGSTPGLILSYWTDSKATAMMASPKTAAAGTYYIKGATPSGKCFDIQPVTVSQPDSLRATLTQTTLLNCAGDTTGVLTVNVTMGTAPYTYQWSTIPSQTTAAAINLPSGIYTVVVTDAKMCTAAFTGEIKEPAPIKIGFVTKPVQCLSDANGSAKVDTINGSTDLAILNSYKYLWATSPAQTTREAVRLTAWWQKVTLTDPKGCVQKDSVFIDVLDVTPPVIDCPKDIELTVAYIKSTDGSPNKYTVKLGTPVTTDNCTVDTLTNDAPVKFRKGLTKVIWTVTDQVGLVDTCTQNVFIKEIPTVPQLISPNGDGVNDTFVIEGLTGTDYEGSQMTIFTRSAQLVFQSNYYELPENAWDGRYSESTFNKNSLVAPGVYYYILKLGGTGSQTLKGYIYVYY